MEWYIIIKIDIVRCFISGANFVFGNKVTPFEENNSLFDHYFAFVVGYLFGNRLSFR